MTRRRHRIELLFATILTVFCITVCCQRITTGNYKEEIIRREDECNDVVDLTNLSPEFDGYSYFVNLDRYQCRTRRRGFKCPMTFRVSDIFSLLGSELCVDIQGVDDAVRNECQLYLAVRNPTTAEVLWSVHCSSHLRPADSPYYVCTQGNNLTLLLETMSNVRVCPTIYEYLFSHRVFMGSISLRSKVLVYEAHLTSCTHEPLPETSSFIVKVFPPGYRSGQCSPYKRANVKLNYSKMRGCLTLLYMSNNYFCNIDVTLNSYGDSTILKLTANRGGGALSYVKPASVCKEFDADNGDAILNIMAHSDYTCFGKFAFEVSFTPLDDGGDGDDEDSKINSPRVFMAVFIALIIICIICLALTCLCCIRFRTKRLRNARRRHHHGANRNQGYDGPTGPMPSGDGSISWSQSDPGTIFGLPTYEEVAGERPSGANPTDDGQPKDDLPPAYDSIFSSES